MNCHHGSANKTRPNLKLGIKGVRYLRNHCLIEHKVMILDHVILGLCYVFHIILTRQPFCMSSCITTYIVDFSQELLKSRKSVKYVATNMVPTQEANLEEGG